MLIKGRFLFWILVGVVSFCFDTGAAQTTHQEIKTKLAGLVNSVIMNAEGMVQGDVLVYQNQFFDLEFGDQIPNKGTMEINALYRIVFDHDKQQYLMLFRKTFERLDPEKIGSGANGRSVRIQRYGIWLNVKEKQFLNLSGGRVFDLARAKLEVTPENNFYDPRSIGTCVSSIDSGSFESSRKAAARKLATGEGLLDVSHHDRFVELKFKVATDHERGIDQVRKIRFCNETNMPLTITDYTKFAGGTSQPHEASFCWKEMSLVYVPTLIKLSAVRSYYEEDEEIWGQVTEEDHLHWFSLNEPIPEDLLNSKPIRDPKMFDQLLDPKRNKAVTVLDAMKRRMPNQGNPDNTGSRGNR